jgi:hypothetical protein
MPQAYWEAISGGEGAISSGNLDSALHTAAADGKLNRATATAFTPLTDEQSP